MNTLDISDAMKDDRADLVTGLAWVPQDVLKASIDQPEATESEALVSVAVALDVDFAFVPADEPWALDAVESLHNADIAAAWAVAGVFGRLALRMGWIDALRMTAGEPGALAGALAETLSDTLSSVRAGLSAGVDLIVLADDLAGATGMLLSPDFVLDALIPRYRTVVLAAAEAGVPVIFHSDGDVRALMPALARAGVTGIHIAGLTADAIVVSHAAARAAGLVVVGGIDAVSLVDGARRVGSQAARLAVAGGMFVADDGGITTVEEIAAFAAALDTARDVFRAEREF